MITLRRDLERRRMRRRRLVVWRTFDPRDRADPLADGFGALVELDEIHLPPGAQLAPLGRRDAEILTYVIRGALAQEDEVGRSGVLQTGELQRLTLGRYGRQGERNASSTDEAHVLRVSLRPAGPRFQGAPEQRRFSVAERRGLLCVVASPDGQAGSLHIHLEVRIYSALLDEGRHVVHALLPGRGAWLHVVSGEVALGDLVLTTGDGVGIEAELAVSFTAREETEVLLIDLPGPTRSPGVVPGPTMSN